MFFHKSYAAYLPVKIANKKNQTMILVGVEGNTGKGGTRRLRGEVQSSLVGTLTQL